MMAATRRVKAIYSVIASPNRLEILRILNTKGPLTYSELKTLAGFKSKKESGKFAYHLRKLVRQILISLNRSERKYSVTNLGRLVLSLTRQIEEHSVVESGKLYVRTSRHMMEEFNSNKILQSLVKEAGMPIELAQKIASESESRLYKFQATYLTSPLIREMVNAILIEHGYEEYRHKLTRLGLPVYDVAEMVEKAASNSEGIESIVYQTARTVFSEYLLLAQLPRDVSDAHLAGDIHISNPGCWGLLPDTSFVDLASIQNSGINPGGRIMVAPRIPPPASIHDATLLLSILTSLLTRETAVEVSFENLIPYIAKFSVGKTKEELKEAIRRAFLTIPVGTPQIRNMPNVSFHLGKDQHLLEEYDDTVIQNVEKAILEAYREYVRVTPMPKVRLVETLPNNGASNGITEIIGEIVDAGGLIALSTSSNKSRAYTGLKRDLSESRLMSDNVLSLHSLSLNLPRLAYDSGGDETYFRAKLALLLQLSINALATRRKILSDILQKGLLPIIAISSGTISSNYLPLVVNLTGLNEAVSTLIGERGSISARTSLSEKVIETARKVITGKSKETSDSVGVSSIRNGGASRFAALDSEKYGKSTSRSLSGAEYSETPVLDINDLLKEDSLRVFESISQRLNGGSSIVLDVPQELNNADYVELISKVSKKIDFFKFRRGTSICRGCGAKLSYNAERCNVCRSISLVKYWTDIA